MSISNHLRHCLYVHIDPETILHECMFGHGGHVAVNLSESDMNA